MTSEPKVLESSKRPHLSRKSTEPLMARDVMSPVVITVQPSTTVKDVADLLISNAISGAPVLDSNGHVIGIITEWDLLAKEEGSQPLARAKPLFSFRKASRRFFRSYEGAYVSEMMSTPVITKSPTTPLREIAATLRKSAIHVIPIVEKGRLVGIVSRRDVLKALQRSDADLAEAVGKKLTDAGIDLRDVKIRVEQGVVRVVGSVSTRSEFQYVEEFIRDLDAVIDVDVEGLRYLVDDFSMYLTHGPI